MAPFFADTIEKTDTRNDKNVSFGEMDTEGTILFKLCPQDFKLFRVTSSKHVLTLPRVISPGYLKVMSSFHLT